MYVRLGKMGEGKRDLGNKIFLGPDAVSESDSWVSSLMLTVIFRSPFAWCQVWMSTQLVDPLGFLVNAAPSLCMLCELPLCVNSA